MSIKHKYRNRRTKRKHGARMTKKFKRHNQKHNRQKGGGVGCSRPSLGSVLPQYTRSNPLWKFDIVSKKIIYEKERSSWGINNKWVTDNIKDIITNMETEEEVIQVLEEVKFNVNTDYDMNTFRPDLRLSLLSYLISATFKNEFGCDVTYHKLIRWVIERGANVNYTNMIARSANADANEFTIVSEAIELLFKTAPVTFADGEMDVDVLYEFYNCLYNTVLLLSKGANLKVKIRIRGEADKTPLSILIDELKISGQLFKNVGIQYRVLFGDDITREKLLRVMTERSKAEYRSEDKIRDIERVISDLGLLLGPFDMLLELELNADIQKLTELQQSCQQAIQTINPTSLQTADRLSSLQWGVGVLSHIRPTIQSLPPNWEERVDAQKHRLFYYNTLTKQLSWDRPTQ